MSIFYLMKPDEPENKRSLNALLERWWLLPSVERQQVARLRQLDLLRALYVYDIITSLVEAIL